MGGPGSRGPTGGKGRAGGSELNLLRDAEGIVDLDAEIAGGAFELYVRGEAVRLSGCPSSCKFEPALFGALNVCRKPNYRDRALNP